MEIEQGFEGLDFGPAALSLFEEVGPVDIVKFAGFAGVAGFGHIVDIAGLVVFVQVVGFGSTAGLAGLADIVGLAAFVQFVELVGFGIAVLE